MSNTKLDKVKNILNNMLETPLEKRDEKWFEEYKKYLTIETKLFQQKELDENGR